MAQTICTLEMVENKSATLYTDSVVRIGRPMAIGLAYSKHVVVIKYAQLIYRIVLCMI